MGYLRRQALGIAAFAVLALVAHAIRGYWAIGGEGLVLAYPLFRYVWDGCREMGRDDQLR